MPNKTKTHRETPEYVAMLRRMVRGLGRRLADGDPSDLADAVALQRELDAVIRQAVTEMRQRSEFSWQQLAELLREPAPDYDAARPGCCGGCYFCQHS